MVERILQLVAGRTALVPWVFFALTIVLGSMGSPLTSLTPAPIAMSFAGRKNLDPDILGLSVVIGGAASGFAPTSMFGAVTNGVADSLGITPNSMQLFA